MQDSAFFTVVGQVNQTGETGDVKSLVQQLAGENGMTASEKDGFISLSFGTSKAHWGPEGHHGVSFGKRLTLQKTKQQQDTWIAIIHGFEPAERILGYADSFIQHNPDAKVLVERAYIDVYTPGVAETQYKLLDDLKNRGWDTSCCLLLC